MTPSKFALTLQPHPLAERIDLPTEEEYGQVRDDIALNGQHLPIVLYEGLILDGRTRYRACRELGIEPEFREFDPALEGSPVLFVRSMNLARRSLSEERKLAIRQEMVADLRAEGMTNEAIAKALGVSEWTVRTDQKKRRLIRHRADGDGQTPSAKAHDGAQDSKKSSDAEPKPGKSPAQTPDTGLNRGDLDSESAGQEPDEPKTITTKRRQRRSATYAPRKAKATTSKAKPRPITPRASTPSEPEANGHVEPVIEPADADQLMLFYEETQLRAGRFKGTKLGTTLSENQSKRLLDASNATLMAINELWREIRKDYGTTLR